MSLLDDIRKDRDAGTDGPWQVSGARGKFHGTGHQVDAPSLAGVAWVGYEAAEHASCWSDVRRIARVPQMEDEIIRLREGLEEIDMRGKQYSSEDLADMARALLDGKDHESAFGTT